MPNLLDIEEYQFDISQEVRERMEKAENLHRLILDETVRDLKRIYIDCKVYCKFKRVMDMILASCGLVILLVPMTILALAVYIDDPGPVIFSQYRIGRRGKRFKVYKFRTMRLETPKYMSTMEVENANNYITRIGRFLRKMSLDELPQLVNVIKGDMSLVGPRPLISDEYEIHAMRIRFGVYSVRPGITGMAQVHGRDMVTPADKVRWDVMYLQEFGFWTDLKILLMTIPKIFGADGVREGKPENKE